MLRTTLALLIAFALLGCSDASEEPTPDPTGGGEKVVEHNSDEQIKSTDYVDRSPNAKRTQIWIFIESFDSNGKKESAGYVLKDKTKVGYWVHWYENGQKKRDGEFKENGKKRGHWTYWNEDGSIDNENSGIYKDGKKIADLPDKK